VTVPEKHPAADPLDDDSDIGYAVELDIPLPENPREENLDGDGIDWELGVSLPPQDLESDNEPSTSLDPFIPGFVRPTDETWLQADEEPLPGDELDLELGEMPPLDDDGDAEGVVDPSLLAIETVWSELDEDDQERDRHTSDGSIELDDAPLTWDKRRWHEHTLPVAFGPRLGVSVSHSQLTLCGESTQLLHHRTAATIDEVVPPGKTAQLVLLDQNAENCLLRTMSGRLWLWDRRSTPPLLTRVKTEPALERIADIYQAEPGDPGLRLRLETGELFELCREHPDRFLATRLTQPATVLVQTLRGRPHLALRRDRERNVSIFLDDQPLPIALPPQLLGALGTGRPSLVSNAGHLALALHDTGVFVGALDGRRLQLVRGCRTVTALCSGKLGERSLYFAALYSELEERSQLALIDPTTARAHLIAELSVVTDAGIGDLDAIERARIDDLCWDPSLGRLWAVGAFGVACFVPPVELRDS